MKEFWKSVNIWRSYRQKFSGMFFWLTVYVTSTYGMVFMDTSWSHSTAFLKIVNILLLSLFNIAFVLSSTWMCWHTAWSILCKHRWWQIQIQLGLAIRPTVFTNRTVTKFRLDLAAQWNSSGLLCYSTHWSAGPGFKSRSRQNFSMCMLWYCFFRTSTTKFVNIYQILVCIWCLSFMRMLFRFVLIKLQHCMAI